MLGEKLNRPTFCGAHHFVGHPPVPSMKTKNLTKTKIKFRFFIHLRNQIIINILNFIINLKNKIKITL